MSLVNHTTSVNCWILQMILLIYLEPELLCRPNAMVVHKIRLSICHYIDVPSRQHSARKVYNIWAKWFEVYIRKVDCYLYIWHPELTTRWCTIHQPKGHEIERVFLYCVSKPNKCALSHRQMLIWVWDDLAPVAPIPLHKAGFTFFRLWTNRIVT